MRDKNPSSEKSRSVDRESAQRALLEMPREISLDEVMLRVRAEVESRRPPPEGGAGAASELTLEEVMRRVKAEVASRIAASDQQELEINLTHDVAVASLLWHSRSSSLGLKKAYKLSEFLAFADEELVDTAYRLLLHRPADPEGRAGFLSALRSGALSKVELLGKIRFSKEGVSRGVHVDGLLLPYKLRSLCRVPVVGRLLSGLIALLRLPNLSTRIQAVEGVSSQDTHQLGVLFNAAQQMVAERFSNVERQLTEIQTGLFSVQESLGRSEARQSALDTGLYELSERLSTLEVVVKEGQSRHEARSSGLEDRVRQVDEWTRDRHAGFEADMTSLANRMDKCEVRKSEVDIELVSLSEAIAGMHESVKQRQVDIETRVSSLAGQIDACESRTLEVQRALEALDMAREAVLRESDARHRELHAQGIGELTKLVDAVRADFSEDIGRIQQAVNQSDIAHRSLEQELVNLAQTSIRMQSELQAMPSGDEVAEVTGRLQVIDNSLGRFEAAQAEMSQLQQRAGEQLAELRDSRSTLARIEEKLGAHGTDIVRFDHDIAKLRDTSDALNRSLRQVRRGTLNLQRKLIDVALKGVGGNHGVTEDGVMAPEYVDFEDVFRGSREDIKHRVVDYLDTLAKGGVLPGSDMVLDLGCGRGEWLEVLNENGYLCRGVDMNAVQLKEAEEHGADVVSADALSYLGQLEDASVAAITAMHLVEHLPVSTMNRLLDECRRVLKVGGILILETPNPENLTVGACWFYLDPTHRNPIPPQLLQWQVSARGFSDVEVLRLSKGRGALPLAPVPDDAPGASQINRLIELVTCAPDYAVKAINA